jgi:hypothetical protein
MTITQEQLETVFASMSEEFDEEGFVELFETYSRNRRVALTAEHDDGAEVLFHVRNSGSLICVTPEMEVAVIVFNHFAARNLG